MQIKMKYVCSISGREFDSVDSCLKHEIKAREIQNELGFVDDYANVRRSVTQKGHSLPRGTFKKIQAGLYTLLKTHEKKIFNTCSVRGIEDIHPARYIYRVVQESGSMLTKYFSFLDCVCEKCDTLYDQPYNAAHCGCTRLKQEELK